MSLMRLRPYNTRSQNIDDNSDTSSTTSSFATSENIAASETKLQSTFDELSSELLNVKDVIIKNMQSENEGLREKLSSLEIRVISLKTSQKMLEQYGRRNNTKISGIPDSVELTSLEEKVLSVFSNISVDVIGEIILKKTNNSLIYQ